MQAIAVKTLSVLVKKTSPTQVTEVCERLAHQLLTGRDDLRYVVHHTSHTTSDARLCLCEGRRSIDCVCAPLHTHTQTRTNVHTLTHACFTSDAH